MRILHVCPFIGEQMGGSERYVDNLTKLQSKKHDVEIITTTSSKSRAGKYQINGVVVNRIYSPLTIWNVDPICYAIRHLLDADAEIMHIHSYLYSLSAQASIIGSLRRRTSLLQLHGGLGQPPYETSFLKAFAKRAFDETVGRIVLQSSDMVSSVSLKDLKYVRNKYGLSNDATKYLPNAVNTDKFFPTNKSRNEDRSALLYIGDLEHWKGIDILANWVRDFHDNFPFELTMRFVGQGSLYPLLDTLREKTERNGSLLRIELLGQKSHDEIPGILNESDALILPSKWEGLPTVLLEAMATETPVISTAVGDVPVLIQHLKNGLILQNNSVETINATITEYLRDPKIMKSMADEGRKTILNQYSIDRVTSITQQTYEELLGREK